jgi:hypothetical protein
MTENYRARCFARTRSAASISACAASPAVSSDPGEGVNAWIERRPPLRTSL